MDKSTLNKSNAGYTLVETMVVMFIFLILLDGIWLFYNNSVNTNNILTGNLNAQQETRKAFTSMLADIRSALPASNGAYAIDAASSTGFIYYSDIDNDGLKEKIRYFLSNKILKAGITKPVGNPSVYNSADEKITGLIHDVINFPSQPIFSYFDENYNGAGAPLPAPVNITAIRLIKIDIFIDHDPLKPPAALEFTTQVSIRNLKDNL
ncbi:MAG: type II secretion system protein [Patescibacteria group bacterium]|nr:type II secretion system protein [Patescibacteria group bacterium]